MFIGLIEFLGCAWSYPVLWAGYAVVMPSGVTEVAVPLGVGDKDPRDK